MPLPPKPENPQCMSCGETAATNTPILLTSKSVKQCLLWINFIHRVRLCDMNLSRKYIKRRNLIDSPAIVCIVKLSYIFQNKECDQVRYLS